MTKSVRREIPGLYKILPLKPFRATEGVTFDYFPPGAMPRIDSVDRVIHGRGAVSPGGVGEVKRPWYMHPGQDDNLMVLHGVRFVEIYTPGHGKIARFTVRPDEIIMEGEVLHRGPAILVWPRGVFHRIISGEQGSASINLATHYDEFDMASNFDIYDLDPAKGQCRKIRRGEADQF